MTKRTFLRVRLFAFALLTAILPFLMLGTDFSDAKLEDTFLRQGHHSTPDPNIMIWTLSGENSLDNLKADQRKNLADYLTEAGPKQVLLGANPSIFFRDLPGSPGFRSYDARMFFEDLTPDSDGIYRSFPASRRSLVAPEASLAVTAAANITGQEPQLPATFAALPDSLRVRFSRQDVTYPTIPIEKILSRQVDPSIFKGKTLLIDEKLSREEQGLITPLWSTGKGMAPVVFLAEAISTLSTGRLLRDIPAFADMLIVWLLTFLLYFFALRLHFVEEILIGVTAAFGLVWAEYFLTTQFNLLGHPTGGLAFISLALLVSQALRLYGVDRAAKEFAADLHVQSANLTFNPQPVRGEEIWEHLAQMGSIYLQPDVQVLYLHEKATGEVVSKFALGELAPKNFLHVSSIKASPFAEAAGRAVPMETAIPDIETGETFASYMVPLRLENRLYGFWALQFCKRPGTMKKANLKSILLRLAEEMSRHLAVRTAIKVEDRPLLDRLSQERILDRIESVGGLVAGFEQNERFFNHAFTNMNDGVVIFNLMGEVLYFNEKASTDLRRFNFTTAEPNFFEALQTISEARPEVFRNWLWPLLAGSKGLEFEAETNDGKNYHFALHPILDEGQTAPIALFVRMADITQFEARGRLKGKLLRAFVGSMKSVNDQIEQITMGAAESKKNTDDQMEQIREQAQKIAGLLNRLEGYLERPRDTEISLLVPVNLTPMVRELVQNKKELPESKYIQFEMSIPEQDLLILGNPSHLAGALDSLLDLSISHCREVADIYIAVDENEDLIQLRIEDAGYGFPQDYAEDYSGDGPLGKIETVLSAMGAQFEVRSNLGQGTRYKIKLPKAS